MPSRLILLNELVELRLKADDVPLLDSLYQSELRDARPTREDLYYIDRQVELGRANRRRDRINVQALRPSKHTDLPDSVIIEAFRGSTPLARLYAHINSIRDWGINTRSAHKAYVLSCFSELAYLHLTKNELAGRDRYKLFPSLVLEQLCRNGPKVDVRSIFAFVGDLPVEIIESQRFVYMIFKTNSFVVIAVRGTVSIADWGINLYALKTKGKRPGYHRGFFDEASSVLPRLVEAVGDRAPLYLTGHSLGAAVAAILGHIWGDGLLAMTPYLFASPRFGTKMAVFQHPPYGYIARDDLVPHLPPSALGFADAGAPPELVPPEELQFSGSRTLLHWLTPGNGFAKPHAIERYRHALGAEISEAFPATVYIDALLDQQRTERTAR